jgi:CheY-like chemotaxis protein
MDLELESTSLRDAIDEGVAMVRERASLHGLTLDVALDDDIETVVADPLRLKQVVLNLLTNAVKFTPDGGRVAVCARRVADEIHVSVEDSGIGIAEEDRERIFESFQQGRRNASASTEGTGLGLTLSRRIIELHGGRLWLESSVGSGSTFTFSLPMRAAAQPSAPQAPDVAVDESSRSILVIEDDRRSLELMTLYLHGAEYDVHSARDGEQGLALARRLRPSAIVLDIMLPHLDGWDLLALLKADPRTARIPVVIVSMLDARGRGFALGAAEYLVKPVSREAVITALSRWTSATPQSLLALGDDPAVVELLESVSAQSGYRLLRAVDAEAAVALARAEHPAVIVADVLTTGVDVLDVADRVRADGDTAAIPIIVLTEEAMAPEAKARLHSQIDRVAKKSELDRVRLLALIESLTESAWQPS